MLPVNFYGRVVDTPEGKKWIDTQVFIMFKPIFHFCPFLRFRGGKAVRYVRIAVTSGNWTGLGSGIGSGVGVTRLPIKINRDWPIPPDLKSNNAPPSGSCANSLILTIFIYVQLFTYIKYVPHVV